MKKPKGEWGKPVSWGVQILQDLVAVTVLDQVGVLNGRENATPNDD